MTSSLKTKGFCVVSALFMILFASPAWSLGDDEHVQLQFCLFTGGGAVFNEGLSKIPQVLGDQLAAYWTNSTTETTDANFCYGINFEPRLFISFIGGGINFLFHWTSEASSQVTSSAGDDAKYTAQLYGAAMVPTIYLRPYYDKDGYFIIGIGRGTYTVAATVDTEDNSYTVPSSLYVSETYEGKGVGWHLVLEAGMTSGNIVLNCGVAYRYMQANSLKDPSGNTLKDPDTGKKLFAGLTGMYAYAGAGLYF